MTASSRLTEMFSGRSFHRTEEEQQDIFAPVADLMVGVVFIFIILILALSLDLANEKMVPKSTYDAKMAENKKLEDTCGPSGTARFYH